MARSAFPMIAPPSSMRMAARKLRVARAASMWLALVSLLSLSLPCGMLVAADDVALDDREASRLLSSHAASDVPADKDDSGAYDYLIIHYHKTGHNPAYSLTRLVKDDEETPLNRTQNDPFPKRDHDRVTKCPRMDLKPGVMYVQGAPDLFCDVFTLAEELLHGEPKSKKGIKIIHLVRDPFKLAVSNYKHHSKHPTPESWVKHYDVCKEEENPIYTNLLVQTLGITGIMNRHDFDSILDLCHSLIGNHTRAEDSYLYTHLRELDPKEGLLLATTNLIRSRVGDIARMANNVIKLHQLQQLEDQANIAQHHLHSKKRIQVLTLALDDFNQKPRETTIRFLDFVLGNSTPSRVKEGIAIKLAKDNNLNITAGHSDNPALEDFLRNDELMGRILGNIDHVVQDAIGRN